MSNRYLLQLCIQRGQIDLKIHAFEHPPNFVILYYQCHRWIQLYGDAKVLSALVKIGYGRMMFITISTAGGIGEEQDLEIWNGLNFVTEFLRQLYQGKNDNKPSFQDLLLLVKTSTEQIEKEGANEELEAQMNNNGSKQRF
ncbi:MAG: hypothetical protein EZS28_053944 [Streblomastix strix]|uniref:Uncharacterized protein n=1 Tax=Streblomastix strix TaxID=222440 RepID=A0A5J4QZV9_9EUKA|nr:MAG: hypothetical protein EZS28_053944 [Streblomastix strix]